MGCDIHLYAERKEGKVWKTLDNWKDNPDYKVDNQEGERPIYIPSGWRGGKDERFYTDGRNYNLFSALAGVRNYHFEKTPPMISEPKQFPGDSCPEIKEEYEAWGSDAHSASWLNLRELESFDWSDYGNSCDAFKGEVIPKLKAAVQEHGVTDEDVRIVFWFDN